MKFLAKRSLYYCAPLALAATVLASCAGKAPTTAAGSATSAKVTIAYQATRAASIEPCGCTSRPWGGIDREYNALTKIRAERITFYVDAGNSLVGDLATKTTVEKATKRAAAIVTMLNANGLDALLPGPAEFSLGADNLKKVAAEAKFAFVVSNVTETKTKKSPFPTSTVVTREGIRIGVIGIVSPQAKLPSGYSVETPLTAVNRTAAELKGKTDAIVLLSQLTAGENEALSEKMGDIAVVVGADPGFSTDEALWVKGKTLIVDPHIQGHLLGRLDIDFEFPLKGFYSEVVVKKNKAQLQQWDEQIKRNPENKIAVEMARRIRTEDPLEPIPGGSHYHNALVPLDVKSFGEKNSVSALIAKEKERVSAEARKE